ncbi:6-phosphogluconolactonase [Propionimicrobium sp. PCR01-08-3]|uniref:6-phosphogluconolactonase n=1 Tax=Propionimicrobium sp. PCR01-08-3 TaxID=3052086 RepID=UPI00255C3CCD|nr:6-phosphogluconolactonase [Propionimicrobium sp. PCR01-08-3]WIY81616.1 6-phosphogluconolactonase [Propionimicrobium sp. PCR01-08-3]
MSLQRVFRYRSLDELTTSMAGRLAKRLAELQREKERVHLALTGGMTALALYESLATLAQATNLDPARLELWWTSERYVPTTDQLRNSTRALTVLARTLPFVPAQVHPMPSSTGTMDSDEAAYAYSKELENVAFDICLLGMGPDGHVASIYPNHPSLQLQADTTLSVVGVTKAPIDPPERITLTLKTINASNEVWLLASGEKKADVAARAVAHDPALPAGLVHGASATYWFLDRDAAAQLPYYRCRL